VICGVTAGGEPSIVEDGAVAVVEGRIREVGRRTELAARYPAAETYGSPDDVVLPGLVNAHHHVGLSPFQLGSPDLPLELWGLYRNAEPDVDPYFVTLCGAMELVASGVTAVQHLHRGASGATGPDGWMRTAREVLRAYADVGMRATFSFGLRDRNYLVYADDKAFIAGLPIELRSEATAFVGRRKVPIEAQLTCVASMLEGLASAPNELVRIQVAPTNPVWCSDDLLIKARDLAASYRTRLNIHVLETIYQQDWAARFYGTTAVRHMADLGVLGPDTTISHAVWLTPEDLDILANTGTVVCHNPSSNLRLRSGLAPIVALASRGVPVAIGIDEAGIDDRKDILEEMRLALSQQQGIRHGAPGLSATQVFGMCTRGGARSTGFDPEIGFLEPGRSADLVVLDWTPVETPYLDAGVRPIDAVVRRAKPPVKAVFVAGRAIFRDGQFVHVDREAIHAQVRERLSRGGRPEGVGAFAQRLLPHVRDFYSTWAGGNRDKEA
jgi:cytosine/adenosine deaminase-related metal-dependent hydrolase